MPRKKFTNIGYQNKENKKKYKKYYDNRMDTSAHKYEEPKIDWANVYNNTNSYYVPNA